MNSMNWNICRVCLESCEQGNFQSIFHTDLNDNTKIFIKICDCSGILIIENDQYTNLICHNCMEDLKNAYNFRKRCQSSDKKLRENIKLENQHETNENHIKDELIDLLESIKTDSFQQNVDNIGNTLEVNNICNDINYKQPVNCKRLKSSNSKFTNNTTEIDKNLVEPIKKVKRKYTKKATNTTSEKKVKQICKITKPKTGEKFPCEYCGHNYSDKITLRYHMRKHTNEMHYVCELCGTAFETNYKLTRHKRTHTGEKPYSCRFCERTFLHSSNRNLHEKRLHTHIRNHQCEYCVKAFHTPCQLKKHIRVHTGEKPYICELCGTGFKAKSHLTAHMHSLVPCVVKMNLKNKIQIEK